MTPINFIDRLGSLRGHVLFKHYFATSFQIRSCELDTAASKKMWQRFLPFTKVWNECDLSARSLARSHSLRSWKGTHRQWCLCGRGAAVSSAHFHWTRCWAHAVATWKPCQSLLCPGNRLQTTFTPICYWHKISSTCNSLIRTYRRNKWRVL